MDALAVTHDLIESVKVECLCYGMAVSPAAMAEITSGGQPASVHEYPTTGGITMVLPEDVYLNAPFVDPFVERSTVALVVDDEGFALMRGPDRLPVRRILPLPGYLDQTDSAGRPITDVAMSHADRVRLSPFAGCAYDCRYCDVWHSKYVLRPASQLAEALDVAVADEMLPVRHAMISGGSPKKRDYGAFAEECLALTRHSPVPMDIMLSPMVDADDFIDQAVEAGAAGFSINIEVFSGVSSLEHLGRKFRVSRRHFETFVGRAVDLLGSTGRVRSLIIPGLESPDDTIAGVEYLLALGVTPTLSPFRPSGDIRLSQMEPCRPEDLANILSAAREMSAACGVPLGPTCVPCQHNTLTFPWDI